MSNIVKDGGLFEEELFETPGFRSIIFFWMKLQLPEEKDLSMKLESSRFLSCMTLIAKECLNDPDVLELMADENEISTPIHVLMNMLGNLFPYKHEELISLLETLCEISNVWISYLSNLNRYTVKYTGEIAIHNHVLL